MSLVYLGAIGAATALATSMLFTKQHIQTTPWVQPDEKEYSVYPPNQPAFHTEPDAIMEPRMAEAGVGSVINQTLLRYMDVVVQTKGDKVALRVERNGAWLSWTWKEYRAAARAFAKSLISIGFEQNQTVAIVGFNSPEWFFSLVGGIAAGGKAAGVYTTNTAEACQYVLEHSEAPIAVVEDKKQLDKLLSVHDRLPKLKHIVVYSGVVESSWSTTDCKVLSFADFVSLGRDVPEIAVDERIDATKVGNCASLIYTSGTTGNPKAVSITHDTIVFEVNAMMSILPKVGIVHDERIISFLPLSHVAGQVVDIYLAIIACAFRPRNVTITFARPDALKGSLIHTLHAVRPTAFLGVPRFWEKMVESMKEKARSVTGVKRSMAMWAKNKGLEGALASQIGGSGYLPRGYWLADKLILSKVRYALGLDQCEICLTGAAPISRETLSFMGCFGVIILELYGMSECCGATTASTPTCYKWGSCGVAIPGTQIRIDHVAGRDKQGEGEICYRGRHIMMGYMKNVEKTKEAIDPEGWLHSGDVGRVDADGFLFITGRIKELIITAGGENIAPVPIEDELKRLMPAVSNAMMVGDRRKYNVVLLTLKTKPDMSTGAFFDDLSGDAVAVDHDAKTVKDAQGSKIWKEYLTKGLAAYNTGPVCVSNAQKVQKFFVLPTDFSIPGDELTGTMKVKRNVVCDKYHEIIEELYKGAE